MSQMSKFSLSGQSLMEAMVSFGCAHEGMRRVYPPSAARPDRFDQKNYPYDWILHCSKCDTVWGRTDHEIVMRAVILEALKELR